MRIGIKLGVKKKLLCILFSNLKYSTDEVFLSIDANFYDYCILFSNLKYSTDEVFLSIDANFYDYCPHNFLVIIPQI